MYESFFGFKEKPFNLTPDPDYLFMSRGHEETFTHLEYAITENKGFVVITGEIGSGKTTLINFLLRKLQPDIEFAVINNTLVQPKQFVKMICHEFELSVNGMDKAEMLDVFYNYLLTQFSEKKRVALIVDESQNLPDKTLEEIRMLSNLESDKTHLLQILLVGQPELKHKLQRKQLEQFIQRVTVYWHLDGLDSDEVYQYIQHRLWVAGSREMDVFNKGAIEAIFKYSRGIPRLINILCDAALIHGYADEIRRIDHHVVEEVVKFGNIGGLLVRDEEETEASAPQKKEIHSQFNHKIAILEEKINTIENTLAHINQELEIGVSARSKRDELVLELTRMLKHSMTSQANLMLEIIDLKQKIKGGQQADNLMEDIITEQDRPEEIKQVDKSESSYE